MKIYNLVHKQFRGWSPFGGSRDSQSHIGTFATKELALEKLAKIREKIASGQGMEINDFSSEKSFGFGYSHEIGSMSFIPGMYECTEQEVISKE